MDYTKQVNELRLTWGINWTRAKEILDELLSSGLSYFDIYDMLEDKVGIMEYEVCIYDLYNIKLFED